MKAKQQSGFTLIELIMVIVILGILAAVAIPQFIDLRTEARDAAAQGVAGALASASAINYAARVAGNINSIAITADAAGCTAHASRLQGGTLPTGYSIGGTAPNCTVTASGSSANWTAIVVP